VKQCLQADIELLEELRDFVKARTKLEVEFAQSLQKLAASHLAKRKTPEAPAPNNEVYEGAHERCLSQAVV
jgi:hypothetical protein